MQILLKLPLHLHHCYVCSMPANDNLIPQWGGTQFQEFELQINLQIASCSLRGNHHALPKVLQMERTKPFLGKDLQLKARCIIIQNLVLCRLE